MSSWPCQLATAQTGSRSLLASSSSAISAAMWCQETQQHTQMCTCFCGTCTRAAACRGRGLVSFFPVHPTSMSNTNRLLSGDNKGAAEQLVEKHWAAKQKQEFEPGFAAAFVQSNGADTSPNVLGTFCADTGVTGQQHVLLSYARMLACCMASSCAFESCHGINAPQAPRTCMHTQNGSRPCCGFCCCSCCRCL